MMWRKKILYWEVYDVICSFMIHVNNDTVKIYREAKIFSPLVLLIKMYVTVDFQKPTTTDIWPLSYCTFCVCYIFKLWFVFVKYKLSFYCSTKICLLLACMYAVIFVCVSSCHRHSVPEACSSVVIFVLLFKGHYFKIKYSKKLFG